MNRLFSFRHVALAAAALTILGTGFRAPAAHSVPFQGQADVVLTSTQPPLTAAGTGKATHLGRFTRTETIYPNPDNPTFTGTLEFIAANGDKLCASMSGQFTSPTGDRAEGTYTFTGGTGRFKNATGSAVFEVSPDGVPNFDVTFSGTIQY